MSTLADVATAVLTTAGVAFVLLAALGLHRFEDVFSRIHAATKAVTLGLVLVIAGAMCQVHEVGDAVKLGMAAVLQLVSAPVAAHMLARASYQAGTELSPRTTPDELAEPRD